MYSMSWPVPPAALNSWPLDYVAAAASARPALRRSPHASAQSTALSTLVSIFDGVDTVAAHGQDLGRAPEDLRGDRLTLDVQGELPVHRLVSSAVSPQTRMPSPDGVTSP